MSTMSPGLVVRWTVGAVSPAGFEALRLSIHSAFHLFGELTTYAVCVNSIPVTDAKARTGPVPGRIQWIDHSRSVPSVLTCHFGPDMGEGVGWKLAPLRLFPNHHELSLDNDVILWRKPDSMAEWMEQTERCLIAQDVERCLGQFDADCPAGVWNSGIRGLPPAFPYEHALRNILDRHERRTGAPVLLASELDEQGLQVAALSLFSDPFVVTAGQVAICSPFWPKQPSPGDCGAHFVGLNAHHLPWNYYGRPADDWMKDHWQAHRPMFYDKAGLPLPPAAETLAS